MTKFWFIRSIRPFNSGIDLDQEQIHSHQIQMNCAPILPPTEPPSDCEDFNPTDCEYWADIGECEANPGFMLEACPKSCDACPEPPTVPSPQGEPEPPVFGDCFDNHPHCTFWRSRNECELSKDWMDENCARSCGLCLDIRKFTLFKWIAKLYDIQ